MASYLQRYLRGEYITVWDELVALGDFVREEPIYSDAQAVAKETMRRVRYNLELVIPRLRAQGYVFLHDDLPETLQIPQQVLEWAKMNPPLHTKPSSTITTQLDKFEQDVGMLPLSLRTFYEEIGGINFIGWYRKKNILSGIEYLETIEEFDPVFVYAFHPNLVEETELWLSSPAYSDDWVQIDGEDDLVWSAKEHFNIIVAPDRYHKANVSGGPPVQIQVPSMNMDAPLLYADHHVTFVQYLRICCDYIGLPGLKRLQCPFSDQLNNLRVGMLPL